MHIIDLNERLKKNKYGEVTPSISSNHRCDGRKASEDAFLAAAECGNFMKAKTLLDAGYQFVPSEDSRRNPLLIAMLHGHANIVKLLLEYGADPNAWWRDFCPRDFLIMPIKHTSRSEMFRDLIAKGLDINLTNKDGDTHLMWAAAWGQYDDTAFLIREGADITVKKEYGLSAFSQAAGGGYTQILKLLRDQCPVDLIQTDGLKAMRMAYIDHKYDAIDYLLKEGLDVTTEQDIFFFNKLGFHFGIVSRLIDAGASVNIRDHFGETPLSAASTFGQVDIIKLFLRHGGDVNFKNADGTAPLHWAAYKGNLEAATVLVKAGAMINAEDEDNKTALDYARENGQGAIVRWLKRKGARSRLRLN